MPSCGKYIISIAHLMDLPTTQHRNFCLSNSCCEGTLNTSAHSSCPCRAQTHSVMLPSVVSELTTHLQHVLYTAIPRSTKFKEFLHITPTPKQMKQELSFDLLLNTGLKKPLILQFLSYTLCCTTATKITTPRSNCRL